MQEKGLFRATALLIFVVSEIDWYPYMIAYGWFQTYNHWVVIPALCASYTNV
jgi:hypothetical protein